MPIVNVHTGRIGNVVSIEHDQCDATLLVDRFYTVLHYTVEGQFGDQQQDAHNNGEHPDQSAHYVQVVKEATVDAQVRKDLCGLAVQD